MRVEVAAVGIRLANAVEMGAFTERKDGVIDLMAFQQVLQEVGSQEVQIAARNLYPAVFYRSFTTAVSTRRYLSDIGTA
jgi:inosose dehydratase